MKTITIYCACSKHHEVTRDKKAPKSAISMGCNWCPDCEDTAQDYYDEWYNFNEGGDGLETHPSNPNQLVLDVDGLFKNKEIDLQLTNK